MAFTPALLPLPAYAVAERHHGGTHVVIGIVALWNLVGSGKRALEVTARQFKINLDPADARQLAVRAHIRLRGGVNEGRTGWAAAAIVSA